MNEKMSITEYRKMQTRDRSRRKKYAHQEFDFQVNVANFLNANYSDVPFESSMINLSLTEVQGARMKAISDDNFKPPDMKIFAARHGFHGLFLELKTESPFKIATGEIKKSQNDHLAKQWAAIRQLRAAGYHADFYWEFEKVRKVLNWYLG